MEEFVDKETLKLWEARGSLEKNAVEQLGSQIGYGRMMQLAEECWRESLERDGWPTGGEFTSGVCRGMLDRRGFTSSLELMSAYDILANDHELIPKVTGSLPDKNLQLAWVDPEIKWQAEEYECANTLLDELNVPRMDDEFENVEFSLVGRIQLALENVRDKQ